MKLATTTADVTYYTSNPVEAVRFYEGTGFTHLDYSFDYIFNPDRPFMTNSWKDQIWEVKAAADALGFDFVQSHAADCPLRGEGMDVALEGTIRTIEACNMLGIDKMVLHTGMWPDFRYPDDQEAYHKANEPFLRALIPAMEKYNVRVLLENTTIKHTAGGSYFPILGKDLNAFVEFLDHPLFGIVWDVGHANMDLLDHQKEINDMGKNLMAIHVHDNDTYKDLHTAPFCGRADFDSLMRGLLDIDFQGYFTLEAESFFKYNRMKFPGERLEHPTKEIKHMSLKLLHLIGKTMLEAYGIYEE